ncbi:MAG: 50S ribosome-binding GTPase, partial [Candidatus Aminicenantes bacterium]|nr:50S ribosome-binding GTPase [Candidatus Aminicenantes bacterium]
MSRPKPPVVVLVGQPNSGKSTLFNAVAGPKAETSNFPGTSVAHTHSEVAVGGRILTVVDLPGTYSLCPSDSAERVALSHIFLEKPDLIINVVDASALARHLELTLELLEFGAPLVVALNMVDLAERKGINVDPVKLAASLGVPVVATIAAYGRGVKELLEKTLETLDRGAGGRPPFYSEPVEDKVRRLEAALPPGFPIVGNRRFTAAKLIEMASPACGEFLGEVEPDLRRTVDSLRAELETARGAPAYEVIAAERHHLAMKLSEEASRFFRGRRLTWDKKVDAVLMHPVLGYLILAAVFVAFFVIIFKVGSPLEGLILKPLEALRGTVGGWLGGGLLHSLAAG